MASSSETLGPRFHDYLNGLREVFELQSDPTLTKSLRANRFNIYLGGLSCEFELMAEEVESLRRERDEYKAKGMYFASWKDTLHLAFIVIVEAQAKELQDARHNFFCRRCSSGTMNAPRLIASPKITPLSTTSSQPQYLDKPNIFLNALRGVNLTQETARRSTQSTTIGKRVLSIIAPTRTDAIVAHSRAGTRTLSSSLQTSTSTFDPHSGPEGARSITFNKKVKKELHVEIAYELSHRKAIRYVKFSQDGKYLAAGCLDGKAYIYDVETGTLMR